MNQLHNGNHLTYCFNGTCSQSMSKDWAETDPPIHLVQWIDECGAYQRGRVLQAKFKDKKAPAILEFIDGKPYLLIEHFHTGQVEFVLFNILNRLDYRKD